MPDAAAKETVANRLPEPGELVQVRSRRWLVEEVIAPTHHGESAVVRLACADDDAQGQTLDVYWECEPDRLILEQEGWANLAARGFDPPRQFAAFLHTLRWNCVTATNPNLFQSPFRAGIRIDAYQLEPLRKALRLPRVNLFIADETGLGKTIEAGLIARELLLRRKVRTIVVAAPPSMLEQWRAEMEERFGLVFEVMDRAYFARVRRERGFGVNPWRTHSRFLISHNLLIDPVYTDPMREWLGQLLPASLLILDEAHHAAPASGARYAIETKFTRAVRDLAGRFEHRLFLSATPHNGHSNSFSTLMEILDPYRFTRGVRLRPKALEEVMVRRLKEDIRAIQGGFPIRRVERIVLDGLPPDAPELVLSRLLDEYRSLRERRFARATRRAQASAGLLVVGLQQRLLSSIEAFARSLKVHRATVEREWRAGAAGGLGGGSASAGEEDRPAVDDASAAAAGGSALDSPSARTPHGPAWDSAPPAVQQGAQAPPASAPALGGDHPESPIARFTSAPDADDERAEWSAEEEEREEEAAVEAVTAATEASAPRDEAALELWRREQALLEQMTAIAEAARYQPDAKVRYLIEWIRTHLCPELPPFGQPPAGDPPKWLNRRVLIFTENREGTKRYLRTMLEQAIASTDRHAERIEVIDGLTSGARRREIQRRFNTDPAKDPLRILIATDAAREGLNFQAHCADLFHFDLPWNPARIEQRNGRIDRKLQPSPEVRCHYFVLPQRAEDHVLEVLALIGFTRLEAVMPDIFGEYETDVERAPLAHEPTWFPAVENRGEGIFLLLRAEAVARWLARPAVGERLDALARGHERWAAERKSERPFAGGPYLLLHSLSHLLIQSLAVRCGYPASSIRERIYADQAGGRYGLLLYTGTPDAEGTLGGLVQQARHIEAHLAHAFRLGRLCSNDPICAQHMPGASIEARWLHGAACHGCALVAETSCEMRNDYLDRALVVPVLGLAEAAFFGAVE